MGLVINIDDIPDGEEYTFDLVEKPDYFKVDSEEGAFKKDVRIQGHLTKAGREVYLDGTVSTEMELVCTRCLGPVCFPVQVRVTSHYIPGALGREQDADVELHASDVDVEFYAEDQIDLTQAVYDQMMLSLPLVRLCREDCKGLCPQCGVNRNKKECRCPGKDSIDPRLMILQTLKDKLK